MLYRKTITLAVGLACATLSGYTFSQQNETSNGDAIATTTLPEVQVTAVSDGSSEHSGSYVAQAVTIGSKIPQTVRETPFSVSVVTRQRLDDQNIIKMEDVLKQTTGITVTKLDGSGNSNSITARGFGISSIQLDGLPISQATSYSTVDTAIYDRIEILRGPSGLLLGAGEPGGTINLVRKRARADFAGSAAAMLGSWNAKRAEFDLTGKLTESGNVRGRIVGVADNRDSHIDVVKNDKTLAYGTLEIDLSSRTTLSLGASQQKLDTVRDLGLPTYADGTLLNVPRSTFAGRNGNTQKQETSDMFAELEHHLDGGGLLKFSAREVERFSYDIGVRANSAVNPLTGLVTMQGAASRRETVNRNLDAYITTPFDWGGRTHRVLAGLSYASEEDRTANAPGLAGGTLNIFQPNYSVPLPALVVGPYSSGAGQTQTGAYGQLQLKPFDRWTFLLGGRVSWWDTEARNLLTGVVTPAPKPEPQFTPLTGVIFDLNDNSSLYGSYAETFVAQTALDVNNKLLPPRTGSQIEFGIKSEFFNKRMNTHLAVFRILDNDRAIADPNDISNTKSIAGGEVRSQGWEAEVSGQIKPGWEVTAGYAYTDTKYLKAPVSQLGQVFSSITPKHNLNLWSKHTWRDGAFNRWSAAGGLRSVSETYAQSGNVRIIGKAYTVANAQVGYQISQATSLSLTVNNLFDKIYYEKISGVTRQNFYGEPRSVTLALRTAW
ncbi:TonB-dependent siderophore receptor [Herminiimonas sp. NPDC097707]|uniref:TonB-dependent siderophore receptor n=1 Tax=Herminiimonas sp. NPDC097707 TaxID=3364007 RepID=UPI00383B3531